MLLEVEMWRLERPDRTRATEPAVDQALAATIDRAEEEGLDDDAFDRAINAAVVRGAVDEAAERATARAHLRELLGYDLPDDPTIWDDMLDEDEEE